MKKTFCKTLTQDNDKTDRLEQKLPVSTERRHIREVGIVIMLTVFLVLLVGISFIVGTYAATPASLFEAARAYAQGTANANQQQTMTVMFGIRLPRILLAAMVGAALSIAGASYQGIFRNPMVSPDILGVSAGASVGVAFGLLIGMPTLLVHSMSFAFGIISVLAVLGITRIVGGSDGQSSTTILILTGIVIAAIGNAVLSLLKYVADPDDVLPAITYWLMGSFARSGNAENILVMFALLLIGGGVLMALRWRLNVMTFGNDEARTLGVNVRKTQMEIILASTLMTSATVCLCGIVGWVGLIIPHITRLLVGPNYRALLPVSLLTGACFMLAVDDVARVIVPGELPIGVLTALIGAPLFIYMLIRGRKQYLR